MYNTIMSFENLSLVLWPASIIALWWTLCAATRCRCWYWHQVPVSLETQECVNAIGNHGGETEKLKKNKR